MDRKIWAQLQKNDLLSEQAYQSWVIAWAEARMVDRKTDPGGCCQSQAAAWVIPKASLSLENSSVPFQTKISDLLTCQWARVDLLGVAFTALQAYSVKCKPNIRASRLGPAPQKQGVWLCPGSRSSSLAGPE